MSDGERDHEVRGWLAVPEGPPAAVWSGSLRPVQTMIVQAGADGGASMAEELTAASDEVSAPAELEPAQDLAHTHADQLEEQAEEAAGAEHHDL